MTNSIKTLFTSFMQICLFRMGPQDLPASNFFLGIIVIISVIVALLLNLINLPLKDAVLIVMLNLAVVTIITQFILRLYNKPMRFVQTLGAQMGTGIVISIFAAPVVVMLQYANTHNVDMGAGLILWVLLLTWEIAVTAHILRNALACSFVQGFLIAIIYPIIFFQLTDYFLPST